MEWGAGLLIRIDKEEEERVTEIGDKVESLNNKT